MGQLQAAIYGIPLSDMNKMTTMGRQFALRDANSIKLYAYEEGAPPSLVFAGTIFEAWADMQAAPSVCFRVAAHAGGAGAVKQVDPTTMSGSVKVADVMKQVCQKGGWQFENNGVDAVLNNPYLPGSAFRQAISVMKATRCLMTIDKDTLAIWKPGGSRAGQIPLNQPADRHGRVSALPAGRCRCDHPVPPDRPIRREDQDPVRPHPSVR